jgi:prepilin-type N-terminal cleavage/methylation domain-containing protein
MVLFKKQNLMGYFKLKNHTLGNNGFTLMELIVVVAIMVMLTTVMVINLAGQRVPRDLKIAQSQLVSNLRKIQSYTLSARTEPGGQYVQFYLMKFDLSKPNQYTIQAMYNVNSSPQYLKNIETISLPVNIRLAAVNLPLYPVSISRAVIPVTQNFTTTGLSCALVAFAAPFGKVYLNDGCAPAVLSSNPYSLLGTDDYAKILPSVFVSNTNCTSFPTSGSYSPAACSASINSSMTITLTDKDGVLSKTITINGITGAITFN